MDREVIFYICTFGILAYIGYCLYMQQTKTYERNNAIAFAKSEHRIATENHKLIKHKLFESIIKVHGKEKADLIAQKLIWTGMERHLLLIAKGKAYNIKESIYKDITTEKWYYGEYTNRLGNYKYSFEITLENDKVVAWKNLK